MSVISRVAVCDAEDSPAKKIIMASYHNFFRIPNNNCSTGLHTSSEKLMQVMGNGATKTFNKKCEDTQNI